MSTLHGRARVGASRELRIVLPESLLGKEVEYVLTINPVPGAGSPEDGGPGGTPVDSCRAHLERFAGSLPDFPDPPRRPGPNEFERRLQ